MLRDAFRKVLSVGADIVLIMCSNGVDQSPIFAVLLGEVAKAYYNNNVKFTLVQSLLLAAVAWWLFNLVSHLMFSFAFHQAMTSRKPEVYFPYLCNGGPDEDN